MRIATQSRPDTHLRPFGDQSYILHGDLVFSKFLGHRLSERSAEKQYWYLFLLYNLNQTQNSGISKFLNQVTFKSRLKEPYS